MNSLLWLIQTILTLYFYILLISVVMSWLIGFNVINPRNDFVQMVYRTLIGLTEPLLRPIRNVLPAIGGLDLSPMVLALGILFTQSLLYEYWPR